jgi:hypothetical protein
MRQPQSQSASGRRIAGVEHEDVCQLCGLPHFGGLGKARHDRERMVA